MNRNAGEGRMTRQSDILMIDDETIIHEAVTRICALQGFGVDAVWDAREALRKLERDHPYRLIICDIMMPDMNGFDFLAEVVRRKISTPVMMTTGYSTVENAVKSLSFSAIDFIGKPFTADEIANAVVRGMRHSEIQKSIRNGLTENKDAPAFLIPCPAGYYSLGCLSWAKRETTGSFRLGAKQIYLRTIEPVVAWELKKCGEEIVQGSPCAYLKDDADRMHPLLSPLSGRIIEVNTEWIERPGSVIDDPYEAGWVYRLIPFNDEYEVKLLGGEKQCP